MKLIHLASGQVFALYHFLQNHPEYYGVELTPEVLTEAGCAVLQYADQPTPAPYQRLIEGPIVDGVQQWALEDLPLDDLKAERKAAVNVWRDCRNADPVSCAGYLFDSDQESQFRVLAVVMTGQGSPTGYWTTADNQDVPADAAFMTELYTAMLTKVSTIHHQQRSMKTAIDSLQTAAEVAAFPIGAD